MRNGQGAAQGGRTRNKARQPQPASQPAMWEMSLPSHFRPNKVCKGFTMSSVSPLVRASSESQNSGGGPRRSPSSGRAHINPEIREPEEKHSNTSCSPYNMQIGGIVYRYTGADPRNISPYLAASPAVRCTNSWELATFCCFHYGVGVILLFMVSSLRILHRDLRTFR